MGLLCFRSRFVCCCDFSVVVDSGIRVNKGSAVRGLQRSTALRCWTVMWHGNDASTATVLVVSNYKPAPTHRTHSW